MSKKKTITMTLEVEYDPEEATPEDLANALDTLLETAVSTAGVLGEVGNPTLGEFLWDSEEEEFNPNLVWLAEQVGLRHGQFGSEKQLAGGLFAKLVDHAREIPAGFDPPVVARPTAEGELVGVVPDLYLNDLARLYSVAYPDEPIRLMESGTQSAPYWDGTLADEKRPPRTGPPK